MAGLALPESFVFTGPGSVFTPSRVGLARAPNANPCRTAGVRAWPRQIASAPHLPRAEPSYRAARSAITD